MFVIETCDAHICILEAVDLRESEQYAELRTGSMKNRGLSAGRRTIAHPHWNEGLLLIQEEGRGGGIKMNPPGSCERANTSNSISPKCFPYSDKISLKCTRHICKVPETKHLVVSLYC